MPDCAAAHGAADLTFTVTRVTQENPNSHTRARVRESRFFASLASPVSFDLTGHAFTQHGASRNVEAFRGDRPLGHIHLGVLPNTVKWRAVVDGLQTGASDAEVLAASAVAAEDSLLAAPKDPGFVEAVRLLAMIPLAARSPDFGSGLRELGILVGDSPMLSDIVAATADRLDLALRGNKARTDFGELTRRALLGTLVAQVSQRMPGLFATEPEDVRAATAALSRPQNFTLLSRAFFTRMLSETLSYYLDRTLSAQVGAGRRFDGMGSRNAFDDTLARHCMEATRIIREFSGAWYSKTVWRDGEITSRAAAGFGAIAMRKITEELKRKRDPDG